MTTAVANPKRAKRSTVGVTKAKRKPRAKKLHPAEQYLRDVIDGRIPASRYVRMAAQRHFRDLDEGHKRGLYFDAAAAQHFIDFFAQFLVHTEGEWDGKPFILHPSQAAKWWILYGWKRAGGYRRFSMAYDEEARGQGKSTQASGFCLYELVAFGEAGAQVFSASTDKKTARLVWDTAALMVQRNDELHALIELRPGVANMHIPGTASKFEALASEHDKLMGLRPSAFCIDEVHMLPNGYLLDVLVSAMGKRKNALGLLMTNSGSDRESTCWKQREYSVRVLEAAIGEDQSFLDDSWFAWIQCVDEDDDWEDERCWHKANPMMSCGVVSIENMRQQALKAKHDPSFLNAFLRFRLSRWTEADVAWMPMHLWDACKGPVDLEELRGRVCIGALDLSSTGDTTCFAMIFPPDYGERMWRVLPRFYLPKEAIQERVKRDRVPYDVWERQGLFTLTGGRTIDYDVIRADVQRHAEIFDLKEICYDRWNSNDLVRRLEQDGFEMVKWGQGFVDMNAPMNRLFELVLNGELAHAANPVLRWMAQNTMAYKDPAGNIKPDKARSKEKIDGIVATIMALGRGMQVGEQYATQSYVMSI